MRFRHALSVFAAAVLLPFAFTVAGAAEYKVHLSAVDEDGKPVDASLWLVRDVGRGRLNASVPAKDGQATIEPIKGLSPEKGEVLTVLTSAPGFAYDELRIESPTGDMEQKVVLKKGVSLSVKLNTTSDRKIGENGRVVVYTNATASAAWTGFDAAPDSKEPRFNLAPGAQKDKDGNYVITIPGENTAMRLMVDAPGVIRGFDAGRIKEDEVKQATKSVTIPPPATLTAGMALPEGEKFDKDFTLLLERRIMEPAGDFRVMYTASHVEAHGAAVEFNADDLSPGDYRVSAMSGKLSDRYSNPSAIDFHDEKVVALRSAEKTVVNFTYKPFDPADFSGDYAVTLKMQKPDGSPAAKVAFDLAISDPSGSPRTLRSGVTSADGSATIDHLKGEGLDGPYSVIVNESEVGNIDFSDGKKKKELAIKLAPSVGDEAPDLTLKDLKTGKDIKLSSLRGQVVMADFWATWCGPCQEPMAHNNEILSRRAKDWDGKATIVAISIDDHAQTVVDHVKKKDWNNVHHLWNGEDGKGWGCTAAKAYGIHSVPTALIIDQSGKIVVRSHPASIEIEKEIDKLIAQNSK